MAWPPTIPPATRSNLTPQDTDHPGDHNAISEALTDLVDRTTGTASVFVPVTPWTLGAGTIWRRGDMCMASVTLTRPTPGSWPATTQLLGTQTGFRPPSTIYGITCFTVQSSAYKVEPIYMESSGAVRNTNGWTNASFCLMSWAWPI